MSRILSFSSPMRYDRSNDLYGLLEIIDDEAPAEIIKAAYLQKIQTVHPDRCPGDPKAEAMARRLNEAKRILLDPRLRAEYNQARNSYFASLKAASDKAPVSESPVVYRSAASRMASAGRTAASVAVTVAKVSAVVGLASFAVAGVAMLVHLADS